MQGETNTNSDSMPDDRTFPSVAYEGLELAEPLDERQSPNLTHQPGLEVNTDTHDYYRQEANVKQNAGKRAVLGNGFVEGDTGKHAIFGSGLVQPDIENEPPAYSGPGQKKSSFWGRRSKIFWILGAVGLIVVVGAVVGGAVGGTVGKSHKTSKSVATPTPTPTSTSSSTSSSTPTPTPTPTILPLDCPKVNGQFYNATRAAIQDTVQYKQFCNVTAVTGTNNLVFIDGPDTDSTLTTSQYDALITSKTFDECMNNCWAFNDQVSDDSSLKCYAAAFNANLTANPTQNCKFYDLSGGDQYNLTKEDLLQSGGPLTAVGVEIAHGDISLVSTIQWLSDNGDWS